MRKAKKLELEAEFDTLVKRRMFSEHLRGEWIAKELYKYLSSEEYTSVVDEIKTVTANLAEYSEIKTQWEEDNKDIIEAERLRTKREELLSADPEALRALGITPPPVQKVSRVEEVGESVKSNDDLMSHDEYLAGLVKIRETKNYGRYK